MKINESKLLYDLCQSKFKSIRIFTIIIILLEILSCIESTAVELSLPFYSSVILVSHNILSRS